MTAWTLTYLLHSTLLLGAAWLLTRSPRVGAETRDAIWKGALFGALLTATLQQAIGGPASLTLPVSIGSSPVAGGRSGATPAAMTVPWIALAWASASGFLAVRLVRGWLRLGRATGRRRVLASGPLRRELDAILLDAGVSRSIVLSLSRGLAVPRAIGTREICVPIRALRDLTPPEQRALLAHEAAHLLRRDGVWLFAAALVQTLAWWQPLTRFAVARLRHSMELCCDDWAASRLPDRMALAECLVKVGEWGVGMPLGVAIAAFAHGSALRERVERLVDADVVEPHGHRWRWLAATPLVVVLGFAPHVTVASLVPAPSAADQAISRSDTHLAARDPRDSGLASDGRLRAAAQSLPPTRRSSAPPARPAVPSPAVPLPGVQRPDEPAAETPLATVSQREVSTVMTMTETLVRPPATLRLPGNVARLVPPATQAMPPIVGKDDLERRVAVWVNYTPLPSFDPYYPKYRVR